jgi:hypothetical protein
VHAAPVQDTTLVAVFLVQVAAVFLTGKDEAAGNVNEKNQFIESQQNKGINHGNVFWGITLLVGFKIRIDLSFSLSIFEQTTR